MIRFLFPHAARPLAVALPICLLEGLIGCARTETIPAYPRMSEPAAMHMLADRAHAITAVSTEAMVTLTRNDGQTVRLDAALVMQPPQRARLRAYKFGQAVFDITLTPDGIWMLASDNSHRDQTISAGTQSADLTRQWMRLATGLFDDGKVTAENSGGDLRIQEPRPDGSTLVCRIDRKTLTIRDVLERDQNGRRRFALKFADYSEFAGVVWPRRIEAISDAGRILVELRDVEINGPIPAQAFKPPARAEKLP